MVLVGIALVSRFTPIYGACCSAQMLHEPVKQSRQLVLRAYWVNIHTVYTAHVENEFSQENIFFLSFPSIDFHFFYDHHYALVYSFIHNKDDTASFVTTLY